jgi:hypothetical protein
MTHRDETTEMTTKHETLSRNRGLMPPILPIEELRYYPPTAEVRRGDRWHTIPVEAVTIEHAREGMVTVGIAGYFEDDAHLYEVDLAPRAAEELALRLLRRAYDIRSGQASDDAEVEAA